MNDDLKLLIEWSSPWQEFRTSIRPALGHSPLPLAGEAPTGIRPYRGMLASWAVEVVLLVAIIVLPAKLASLRPFTPPRQPKYDVIYFSADELPQTHDFGGAQSGRSGRAGGQEARHRTQTIRVVRGNTVTEKVVDAPDLKLPLSNDPVKNLLSVAAPPGPPPAEGVKSNRPVPQLTSDAIVAPPPQALRDLDRNTPNMATTVVAPPPTDLSGKQRTPTGLAASVIPPPPADPSSDKKRSLPGLAPSIVAPPPTGPTRDRSRAVIAMDAPVIQPPPSDLQREVPPLRAPVTGTSMAVPPPVSAPERATPQSPALTLPVQRVVAPPPSQVARDARFLSGASLTDPQKVVAPPVQVDSNPADKQRLTGSLGAAAVVPPPPSVTGGTSLSGGGRSAQSRSAGASLGPIGVVPPPPNLGGASSHSASEGSKNGTPGGGLTAGAVVPPPPNLTGGGSLSGTGRTPGGISGATPTGNSVVPPPPNLSGAGAPSGSGNKGTGFGGPLDAGSVLAPPNAGGSGGGKGVVISSNPGSAEGAPRNGGPGTIAMSPTGGVKSGLGGRGGGAGIVHGSGPGSGLNGVGPGGGKEGAGKGSDPTAHGGISPYPGPGGAGSGTAGQQPALPGVSVQGGSTINLPSFGSTEADPSNPAHTTMGKGKGNFNATVVGSSRAGGAFARYGELAGENYTFYIPTSIGTAVMQYADTASASHPYIGRLTNPTPLRYDLPTGLSRSRMVFRCELDRAGVLRNIRVEAGPPTLTAQVKAALLYWKFSPAMLGDQPVAVEAFLGFNVGTD